MEFSLDLGFLKGRQLLVFGCGYLGGAVARRAVAAGAEVFGITRNPATVAALKADGVRAVQAEVGGTKWRVRVPDRAEFVLNCVSAASQTPLGYKQSYIDGNRAIATWAYLGHCGHFIYTSSTGVYAQGGGREVDEAAPLHGGGERAELLRSGEDAACKVKADALTVVRLAGIYGPGRHHFLDTVRSGGPIPGVPDDYMNLIHRDDAVDALLALFAGSVARLYNLSDGAPSTRGEVATWIRERTGGEAPVFNGDPGRGTPNRRIISKRIRSATGWLPRHPTFREGFEALLAEPPASSDRGAG